MNLKEACDLANEIQSDDFFFVTQIIAIGITKASSTYSVQVAYLNSNEGYWWIRDRVEWEELRSTFPPA